MSHMASNEEETKPIAHKIEVARTQDVRFQEGINFDSMMLSVPVRRGLAQAGYVRPTTTQAAAIPVGLIGMDMLIQFKAGIGKTLIFTTVVLESFQRNAPRPQALIVVPTRELAYQIADVLKCISHFCSNFKTIVTVGGTEQKDDRLKLLNAVAVVGTPGRLNALIQNQTMNTSNIKMLVLDECDQLLKGGLSGDLCRIIRSLPAERQTIACSATMDATVKEKLIGFMRNPASISSKGCDFALVGIKQFVYELPYELNSVIEMNLKVRAVVDMLHRIKYKQTALFANSRMRAENYAYSLEKELNMKCAVMSAALDQKSREQVFTEIRKGEVSLFVSTDLMARGFDSEHLDLVINLDMPSDKAQYLHRMGRAGRFGSYGLLITFVHGEKDRAKFSDIVNQLGAKVLIFPKKATPGENLLDFVDIDGQFQKYGYFDPNDSPSTLVCQEKNTGKTLADSKTYKVESNGDERKERPDIDLLASHQDSSLQLPLSNTIDDASSIAADSEHSSSLEAPKSVNYRTMLDLVMDDDSDGGEVDYFDAFEKYKKMCDNDPKEVRNFKIDTPDLAILSDSSDYYYEPKDCTKESAVDSEIADFEEKSSYDELKDFNEQENTTSGCDTDNGDDDVESCATTPIASDSSNCLLGDIKVQAAAENYFALGYIDGLKAVVAEAIEVHDEESNIAVTSDGRDRNTDEAATVTNAEQHLNGEAAKLIAIQRRWLEIYKEQVDYIQTYAHMSVDFMRMNIK